MDTLKYEDISGYLPFGLKVLRRNSETHMLVRPETLSIFNDEIGLCVMLRKGIENFTPILRPMSDWDKTIYLDNEYTTLSKHYEKTLGKIQMKRLQDAIAGDVRIEFLVATEDAKFCYKHHLDIYGLIDRGLAIDVNTL